MKISSDMWRCTTAMLNRLPRPTFESDEPVPEVDPEEVIVVAWCDGQSFERHGGFKKRSGKLWRNLIPFDGPFHEHAHAIFAYVEMYWQSFLFWALSVLKRERVHEIMQSLDDSAYSNYQEAISEIVVGVVTYLLLDVQTPPPRVYLSNAKVYSQLVHSAGGHVLLKFLKYAGWPTLANLSTFIAHVPQMPKDRVGSTRTTTISSGPWPTSRTTSPSRSSSSPPTRRSTPSSGRLSTSPSRSRRSGACGQQRVPGPLHGSKCIEHAFARWIQL